MISAEGLADPDLTKVAELGNELLAKINAVREVDPIVWSDKNQAWLVTGHEEVAEGFRGNLPLTVSRLHKSYQSIAEAERANRIPYLMSTLPNWIINMDPPSQQRLRKLMMKAFSRRVAEDLRPTVRQWVTETLDKGERLQEFDFVKELAQEVPGRVIAKLMGLPDEYRQKMFDWDVVTAGTLSRYPATPEQLDRCEAVLLEMRESVEREIAARRLHPTDDFISTLITARDEDDRLTEDEIAAICYVTMLAGPNTTANSIALSVAALAQHPEAVEFLRNAPDKGLEVAMEIMRFVAMSAAQARVVSADFNWRGKMLKKDQLVLLVIAGANRDPKAFPHPEQMDFSRSQDGNLVFGIGLHFCIGHLFAKLQVSEFLSQLVQRFDVELLDRHLDFGPVLAFRGLRSLNVRLTPRKRSG